MLRKLNINALSLVFMAFFALLGRMAYAAPQSAVLLEVKNGNTAFLVDKKADRAWWIVEECRREIPIEKTIKQTKTITSKMISQDVKIGSHPVKLRQQFRFTLTNQSTAVEVYNSVRGGWSSVPVQVNETCTLDPTCRARMEFPEC